MLQEKISENNNTKVAYFVNQYPKVSHSFIRREIEALENLGVPVTRYALRGWDADVVDNRDIEEKKRTSYILQSGLCGLALPTIKQLVLNPVKFLSALKMALKIGWMSERMILYHIVYLAEACKLIELCTASGIGHIHAHFGTNSTEVVMLARMFGGPEYSFTVHGPEEFDKPVELNLSKKIELSKFVIAISSYGRSQLNRWVSFNNWSKINIVHCGIESQFYNQPEVPVPDSNRFVCVGRLCEQKGQLLLIDAARRLVERGNDFELILAGDGEMRSAVERLIDKFNLQDKVKITGWIDSDRVRKEILDSRALILPSFAEGLPVVIMEAMALRRPVLSTFVAGIPELVLDAENGWLFPAGSIDALVLSMEKCLNATTGELNLMGAAGFKRVIERHNIDTEAGKLARLIGIDVPVIG